MIHTLFLLTAALLPLQSPDTDTTVAVPRDARLRIGNAGGDITIRTWNRSELRVRADHSRRSGVEVDVRGGVVEVRARGRMGIPSMVDLDLTVPTTMGIEISGLYADISIEGVQAPVKVQTVEGDITLRGGAESVDLRAVNGTIDVSGARGRVNLHSASEDVRAADVSGELTIEAIAGDVTLRNIAASLVDVQSISGDIEFEGRFAARGTYLFSTHSGDVTVAMPDDASAMVSLVSASGDFRTSFGIRPDRETRRRASYRFGAGSASVDIETFSGDLELVRPSELRPLSERRARRERDRDRDRGDRRGRNREGGRYDDDHEHGNTNHDAGAAR